MAQILDKQGLQHYANKMCNADNRRVGTKSLPAVLNEIDTAIDGFKTAFEKEYGSPVNMEITNNKNAFTVGTGNEIDKKDDVENSFTDITLNGASLLNCIKENSFSNPSNFFESENNPVVNGGEITLVSRGNVNQTRFSLKPSQGIIKPNTKYTLVFDVLKNTLSGQMYLTYTNHGNAQVSYFPVQNSIASKTIGQFKYVLTSANTNIEQINCLFRTMIWDNSIAGESITFTVRIFEGDWINKEIPEYFEGLKSVGEKQDGNHKLNISSIGKNLCPISNYNIYNVPINTNTNGYRDTIIARNIKIKPNTKYIIFCRDIKGVSDTLKAMTFSDKFYENGYTHVDCYTHQHRITEHNIYKNKNNIITTEANAKYLNLTTGNHNATATTISYIDLQIVEGSTLDKLEPYKENSKEILLTEPLRGLPNGVKDTIEKINGEWKIIRRCGEVIFDGVVNKVTDYHASWSSGDYHSGYSTLLNNIRKKGSINGVADNIVVTTVDKILAGTTMAQNKGLWLENYSYVVYFSIPKRDTTGEGIKAINTWLANNNTKLVYELENYIIEDIDPVTLQCWKNGTISIVDEIIPVETTHTVSLNKSAQIQKNIEELTSLRNRVQTLEEQYNKTALNQAYETELLKLDMKLDNII